MISSVRPKIYQDFDYQMTYIYIYFFFFFSMSTFRQKTYDQLYMIETMYSMSLKSKMMISMKILNYIRYCIIFLGILEKILSR